MSAEGGAEVGRVMVRLCTDSNAQLPSELRSRYAVEVVPLTVTIDGVDHLEGVDLDADGFYRHFAGGRSPEVTTAAPSPGRFADAYRRLAEQGATEILSVHIGSNVSGTLNAAQVAAAEADVPVRLVDTASASFAVGCAVWEAGDALGAGAPVEEAALRAEAVGRRCGNVFVVGALDFARRGGRFRGDTETRSVPVLALIDGEIRPIAEVDSAEAAAQYMADHVISGDGPLRAGIGHSDPASAAVADHLQSLLERHGRTEVIRYRVGPSVGAHTGPGTAGVVFYSPDRR